MAKYIKGPQGSVMKVTKKNGKETYTHATREDIANMSTAQKMKLATRTKGNKKI